MAKKSSLDELVAVLPAVLRSIFVHMNNYHRQDIKLRSPLQIHALNYIKKKNHPSMKELADFLFITPPSATSLIDSMVSERLIVREIDPDDRRAIHLKITAKGKKICDCGFKQMTKHMREILGCLDESEREEMLKAYKKIYNYINNLKK